MLIYNVTVNIEEDVEWEWKQWMLDNHIPEVMETGHFTGYKFLKLLNESPDASGSTYAVQFFVSNIGELETYLDTKAEALRNDHNRRYSNKFVAFRTVLEEVTQNASDS